MDGCSFTTSELVDALRVTPAAGDPFVLTLGGGGEATLRIGRDGVDVEMTRPLRFFAHLELAQVWLASPATAVADGRVVLGAASRLVPQGVGPDALRMTVGGLDATFGPFELPCSSLRPASPPTRIRNARPART